MLALVLLVYTGLFIRWSLNDQVGPFLCCHHGELLSLGLQVAACRGRLSPECSKTRAQRIDDWIGEVLGVYHHATGTRSKFPLAPLFLLYLGALAAIYLVAERLAGGTAGVLIALAALTTDLFSLLPLASGPAESPAVALTLVAAYLVLTRPPGSVVVRPLLAGTTSALAIGAHHSALPGVALLAALLIAQSAGAFGTLRPGRGVSRSRWVGPLLFAAPVLLFLVATLGANPGQQEAIQWLDDPDRLLSGVRYLQGRLSSSLGWSLLWPAGLFGDGFPDGKGLIVLLLLALLSVPMAIGSPGRRLALVVPLLTAAGAAVPLVVVDRRNAAHDELVLCFLLLAAARPVGLGLSALLRAPARRLAVLVTAGVVLIALSAQWTQSRSSSVFRNLLRFDPRASRVTMAGPGPDCRRDGCQAMFAVLRTLDRCSAADSPGRGRAGWACFLGPTMPFPVSLVTGRSVEVRDEVHPAWTWWYQVERTSDLGSVPLKEIGQGEPELTLQPVLVRPSRARWERCRLLVVHEVPAHSSKADARRALGAWQRAPGTAKVQQLRVVRMGERGALRIWGLRGQEPVDHRTGPGRSRGPGARGGGGSLRGRGHNR